MGCGGRRESIFHDDDDDRYKAVLVEGVKANAKLPPERRGFLENAWQEESGKGDFVKICTLTPIFQSFSARTM